MWRTCILIAVLVLLLLPSVANASSGNLTLRYISESEVELSWTKEAGVNNTMVRGGKGLEPITRDDGFLVYYGQGESATMQINLDWGDVFWFRAWAQLDDGTWAEMSSIDLAEGIAIWLIVLLGVGMFLTWFCHKRPTVLLTLGASAWWFALFLFLFLGDSARIGLTEEWTTILMWVLVILVFVPMTLAMNTAIRVEARGTSWTKYGAPPVEKGPPEYEKYRDRLFGRTRTRKPRR